MYCYCKFSVAHTHDAVGWSAVCDCGITYFFLVLMILINYVVFQSAALASLVNNYSVISGPFLD